MTRDASAVPRTDEEPLGGAMLLSLLRDLGAAATSSSDVRGICADILRALDHNLALRVGVIYELDEAAGMLRRLAPAGLPDEVRPLSGDAPIDHDSALGQVLSGELSCLTHDSATRAEFMVRSGRATDAENDRWIAMRLKARGRVVGGMVLAFAGLRPFREDEIALYQTIASQTAIAIANAEFHETQFAAQLQAEREIDWTRALLSASEALAERTNLADLLGALTEIVMRMLWCGRASVFLWDPTTAELRVAATRGRGALPVGLKVDLLEATVEAQEAVRTGRSVVIDYDSLPEDMRGLGRLAEDVRLALVVPMVHREQVQGLILVDDADERHGFGDEEVRLVEAIARQGGVAIQNARLFERERTVAETLQEALLTIPETLPGARFAHVYQAAIDTARVGGDFYDVFEIDDDLLGVMVGDISGKGLRAAVLTSLVKNTVRAYAMLPGSTPAGVLRLTNTMLFRGSEPEMFATIFLGMLDRRTGRLVYCSAGHPTAAVLRRNAAATELCANSAVVGAYSGMPYCDSETRLEDDELLFLYTDGLIEARSEGGFFGEERLFELLQGAWEGDPDGTLRSVTEHVVGFAGGRLTDDLAILGVVRASAP